MSQHPDAPEPQGEPEKVHGDPLLDFESEAAAGGGPEIDRQYDDEDAGQGS